MKSRNPTETEQLESVVDLNTIPELTAEFIGHSLCRNHKLGRARGLSPHKVFSSCSLQEKSESKIETAILETGIDLRIKNYGEKQGIVTRRTFREYMIMEVAKRRRLETMQKDGKGGRKKLRCRKGHRNTERQP